ncbi:MAG: hypothetical protein D8M57_09090 [Candidatus Scalindua sp. AMX11]|nr:MAG: hypothetical protein DWQ00_00680 [Candidatus Scalindua sp.]TDE65189.1 MAG: hypothetical protein D8M57_09090 [Candidatus Scalindua sp. AMX11]
MYKVVLADTDVDTPNLTFLSTYYFLLTQWLQRTQSKSRDPNFARPAKQRQHVGSFGAASA